MKDSLSAFVLEGVYNTNPFDSFDVKDKICILQNFCLQLRADKVLVFIH